MTSISAEAEIHKLAKSTWESHAYLLRDELKQALTAIRVDLEHRGMASSGAFWSLQAQAIVSHVQQLVELCLTNLRPTIVAFLQQCEAMHPGLRQKEWFYQGQSNTFAVLSEP